MTRDNEGFLTPRIDAGKCIGCGKCTQTCPVMHCNAEKMPMECLGARTRDDLLLKSSSSGGIFTELARPVTAKGGVVYGCVFDSVTLEAKHVAAHDEDGIVAMRGSKYVQSDLGNTFRMMEVDLRNGKVVLFCGTPCQIAGLKSFLRQDYDNLLCVSVLCKGAPSPYVFRRYKEDLESLTGSRLVGIKTRAKIKPDGYGWRYCGGNYFFESPNANFGTYKKEDPYISSFLCGYCNRMCCKQCRFRCGKSGADIVIGDFWGIKKVNPAYDDDKGISCVLVYTDKGKTTMSDLSLDSFKVSYGDVCRSNHVCSERMDFCGRWVFMHTYRHLGIAVAKKLATKHRNLRNCICNLLRVRERG